MEISKTLYVKSRKQWRFWLAKNHDKEKEIWLIYYRASSGKKRIPYNDAVEEALCFGWIDSTAKRIDDEKYAQRFSPRRPGSAFSEPNKERVRKLIARGKMAPAGFKSIAGHDISEKELSIPPDILKALKADAQAWKNFQSYPVAYKRIRMAYIEAQRRHSKDAYKKSLAHFIKQTARNRKFGMMR